jgi:hypothetical protein
MTRDTEGFNCVRRRRHCLPTDKISNRLITLKNFGRVIGNFKFELSSIPFTVILQMPQDSRHRVRVERPINNCFWIASCPFQLVPYFIIVIVVLWSGICFVDFK